MSIEKLKAWLGPAAPSQSDTELRRTVRDSVIEFDAVAKQNALQVEALETCLEQLAVCGHLTMDAETEETDCDYCTDAWVLTKDALKLSTNTIRDVERHRITALKKQLDADRAAMAEKSRVLEQAVAEATTREAEAVKRADDMAALAPQFEKAVKVLLYIQTRGGCGYEIHEQIDAALSGLVVDADRKKPDAALPFTPGETP